MLHLEHGFVWCWNFGQQIRNVNKRKANGIGHILRRNCLLQRVIEGKIKGGIEVTGRRERRRRKLLDDLKERGGYSYLKEEALYRTMWRARFGRGFGPVARSTTEWWMKIRLAERTRTRGNEKLSELDHFQPFKITIVKTTLRTLQFLSMPRAS